MDFYDIIGQERTIQSLKNAILNNTIAHSYLFEGPDGMGKMKVAKVFAKTLLCKNRGTDPCNTCSSCIQFDTGNHPDFYVESPEGDYFKREQIDRIQKTIKTLPYEGDRKVYILEDIHKMTQEAENSFLKTLEEPPNYATIILTVTNTYSLLPTIVSRCQILKFTPVDDSRIIEVLINKYNKSKEEANYISSFSSGIVGKAINLAQSEEFKNLREDTISTIDTVLNSDKFRIFSICQFFDTKKEYIDYILDIILIWFRDLLISKEINDDRYIMNKDKINLIYKHSSKLSKDKIYDILKVINKTKDNITSNVNYQLAIEVMLLKMQEV